MPVLMLWDWAHSQNDVKGYWNMWWLSGLDTITLPAFHSFGLNQLCKPRSNFTVAHKNYQEWISVAMKSNQSTHCMQTKRRIRAYQIAVPVSAPFTYPISEARQSQPYLLRKSSRSIPLIASKALSLARTLAYLLDVPVESATQIPCIMTAARMTGCSLSTTGSSPDFRQ